MKKKICIIWSLILSIFFLPIYTTVIQASSEEILQGLNPVLTLSSYEVLEGTLTNGEEVTIRFYVTNSNQYADAYNVIISYYTEDGGLFLPMGASNQSYIDVIERGQTEFIDMKLQVSNIFAGEAFTITMMMEYSNFIGDGFSNTTLLTPNFTKKSELEIQSVFLAKSAVRNNKSLVNITYKNIGSTDITRITMNIEGNIAEEQKSVELEPVEQEKQVIFDYYVNFLETGQQILKISFVYEDENGTIQEIEEKEYTINVVDRENIVSDEILQDTNTKNSAIWLYAGSICAVIAVLLSVVLIYIKWKEKGKKEDE